jgi:hypothetical protein
MQCGLSDFIDTKQWLNMELFSRPPLFYIRCIIILMTWHHSIVPTAKFPNLHGIIQDVGAPVVLPNCHFYQGQEASEYSVNSNHAVPTVGILDEVLDEPF